MVLVSEVWTAVAVVPTLPCALSGAESLQQRTSGFTRRTKRLPSSHRAPGRALASCRLDELALESLWVDPQLGHGGSAAPLVRGLRSGSYENGTRQGWLRGRRVEKSLW